MQLRRERPIADARRVRLHHTDDLADGLRRQSQSGQHSTDAAVAAGHVRVGTEVNVQHGRVGALDQDGLALAKGTVQERDRILNHRS